MSTLTSLPHRVNPLLRTIAKLASRSASHQLRRFEHRLNHCRAIQQNLLQEIVRAHQDSDFGRKHGMAAVRTYADFTRSVSPASYGYYAPYIQRCRQGESRALLGSGSKLLMFALTSGTTAAAKSIPVTEKFAATYRRGWNIWGVQALQDHPEAYLRPILQISSPAAESRSEAGLPCGAISGMLALHQKRIVRRYYAVPPEVADISDADSRYYTIMRLAITRDVAFLSTANPSTALRLAQTADQNAERLIRDVRDGTLTECGSLPPSLQKQIRPRLRAHPRRAGELEDALNHHGRLLPKHYWNLSFLANWTGGTLSLYIPKLKDYYGDLPLRDIGLLASEGRMSIPLRDNTPAGVLDIEANFYEFIPESEITSTTERSDVEPLSDDLTVLQADELDAGERYYILLTTYSGLYRYHIGDIVRVVDFQGTTPVIEFLSKGDHTSSITGEKLTEHQVTAAVNRAVRELSLPLSTYVLAPVWPEGDRSDESITVGADQVPYYRFYLEADTPLTLSGLEQLAECIDRYLEDQNIEYASKRQSRRLDRVRAEQLASQFLTRRDLDLLRANQGRSEQFKHRFLNNRPLCIDPAGQKR